MNVGVLAVQGNFDLHQQRLNSLGAKALLVKKESELSGLDALVLPGGESSSMLRLINQPFRQELCAAIKNGLPTLATCAGVILLASRVINPEQDSFGLIDIEVERNSYGRQINSFIDSELQWTEAGRQKIANLKNGSLDELSSIEGVFIRAPRITSVGPELEVLIERDREPVFVQQRNIFAATFHPELSDKALSVSKLFLEHASRA